ncbi:EF-hand [Neoconidiobolus thromboides FSU 785]|nr:EF-hand [Neoconidiobolus thromboides FSU 785]
MQQNPYNQQQNSAYPPPSTQQPQNQLWSWFRSVDTDGNGQLSVTELQQALVNGDWSPFNYETVRLMVGMFDRDHNGTIGFNEFQGLWKYIEDWKKCFQSFDTDRSGTIDQNELKSALRAFGYNLSDRFINLLITKFDRHGGRNITFDNFIQVCVTINVLTGSFRRFDTDGDGWIQIRYEDFLELVITSR